MARFHARLVGLLTLLLLLGGALPARAQSPISATASAELLPTLPRRLKFTVTASSSAGEITQARVLYQVVGSTARSNEPVTVEAPAASLTLEHEWEMQRNFVPPGAEIEYFWELSDSAGNQFRTDPQRLVALDPRFDWKTVEDERLAISWYDGGQAWGDAMLAMGQEAITRLQGELGTTVERKVRLVAYATGNDFRDAFPRQQDWIGGQAFPDLGVTVQIIGEGETSWMRTVITHELSHLVFAQAMDGALATAPAWLDEGLAMYNEPDDSGGSRDSARQVQRAAEQDRLLPFSQLQGNFGADGQTVGLAYAQSEMIVTHLIEECGQEGFRAFIGNLVNEDMRVDQALEAACGYDSQALYDGWRQTLPNAPPLADGGGDPVGDPARPAAPTARSRAPLVLVGAGLLCMSLLGLAILFVLFKLLRPATPRI